MEVSLTTTWTDIETISTVDVEAVWKVVVHDDPFTLMSVVVLIFRKVLGYSEGRAQQLMLQVHHEGKSVVWSGNREQAEYYCVRLQNHGLIATVEQDQ
jgi:ATP-dependent Clp protease adaptor protein ClpS